jgi:hypothetical protein
MPALWQRIRGMGACVLAAALPSSLHAASLQLSAFGTVGYAVSDQDFQYLRYIDDGGTFKADSLVGVQAEAQFNPQWGVTVQLVGSAPRTRDDGVEAKIRWAFISFRPSNEWLFRVGRLRPPFLINTQNAEVGVTYDQLRLPVEVYAASPVYDVDGGAVTKTWALESSEINLDAYWGKTDLKFRLPSQRSRTTPPEVLSALTPPQYFPERVTFRGLVLTHTSEGLLLRGGLHRATAKGEIAVPGLSATAFPGTFAPITIPAPPPFGGNLYLPADPQSKIDISVLTLGAQWRSGDWRITAEYIGRRLTDTKVGVDGKGAYVTAAYDIQKWTPYVTYARLLSGGDTRRLYQEVNSTPVPLLAQGPPLLLPANYHRILADQIPANDQYSVMLGASYSFSATSKLKFEWMRTHVGLLSSFVDGDVHDKSFNVFSVAYSVAF